MIFLHLLTETLLNAILVTGLVVVMMMMIECFNVKSRGRFLQGLRSNKLAQVVFSAFLGAVPGCMGGFASVSLYTHGMLSFGALVAMMIASSGDEAFVMLAMIPQKAVWITAGLFVLAIVVGVVVDLVYKDRRVAALHCGENFDIHAADSCEHRHDASDDGHRHGRHLTFKRGLLFVGVGAFITALALGLLEHEEEVEEVAGRINLLSEDWMNIMFAILSLVILVVIALASDHFVEEHLWHHIVVGHLPAIFAWTFGILAFINIGLHYFDISSWISSNTALMILLAALVGIIPESGPHMLFVTLYATGVVPLPVLLASCISQDGHACLPLIAESKRSFVSAKLINVAVALVVGFGCLLFI